MVGEAQLVANLRAPDLDAAVAFYTEKLGLRLARRVEILPGHEEAFFEAGGGIVCIEQGAAAATGGATPAGFEVEDVVEAVARLRERGVVFEEYDLPSMRTVDEVATVGAVQAAWFKDPAGNLLALTTRA